jgi:hypothetical protein
VERELHDISMLAEPNTLSPSPNQYHGRQIKTIEAVKSHVVKECLTVKAEVLCSIESHCLMTIGQTR